MPGLTIEDVILRIGEIGIVPVVRASSVDEANRAVEAICAGGIPAVEITMTVPGAVEVIRDLAKHSSPNELLVGAGTVLNPEQAQRCLDAGAQFLVSPGFNAKTVALAAAERRLIMAGALTPTEVIAAWEAGADFIKIFPAGNVGGPKYIKALKGPLPDVPLIPTGGVNLQTAAEFLEAGAAALGIGGELVHPGHLKSGNTQAIVDAARTFVAIVNETRAKKSS